MYLLVTRAYKFVIDGIKEFIAVLSDQFVLDNKCTRTEPEWWLRMAWKSSVDIAWTSQVLRARFTTL